MYEVKGKLLCMAATALIFQIQRFILQIQEQRMTFTNTLGSSMRLPRAKQIHKK